MECIKIAKSLGRDDMQLEKPLLLVTDVTGDKEHTIEILMAIARI